MIGIYGAWGDGKTSVLRLMEESFAACEDIVVINFNPWHFQLETQFVAGFFSTLADALGRKLSTKAEDIGKVLNRYAPRFAGPMSFCKRSTGSRRKTPACPILVPVATRSARCFSMTALRN